MRNKIHKKENMKKSVKINGHNLKIAGDLYLLEGMDVNKQYPAVVVVHTGGGYAVNAAWFDRRIKAVATVSGIDIGGLFRASFGENPAPAIIQLIKLKQNIKNCTG